MLCDACFATAAKGASTFLFASCTIPAQTMTMSICVTVFACSISLRISLHVP